MIIPAGEAEFAALLMGKSAIAPPEVLEMLAKLAAGSRSQFSPSAWLVEANGEIVGLCSLVRPPEDGILTIGYGIAPDHMGKGHASDAVGEIIDWARSDQRVHTVAAETNHENIASQRVLEHNDFARVGERFDDEDGALICWRCETS